MKHKRRHKQKKLHVEVFSQAEIRVAQDALQQFADWLRQIPDVTTKHTFAEETLLLVKSKLATMQSAPPQPVPFEYNEHILLLAAIQAYMVNLRTSPPSPRRAALFRQCEHLKAFALLALETPHATPTQD